MSDRYEIRVGKWGCYMHDDVELRDLTLEDTAQRLNEGDEAVALLRDVIGNERVAHDDIVAFLARIDARKGER